jgi:hypothetical protein
MAPPRVWFAKGALLCRSQGRKSNEVSIAAFDQPPAVCFGPRPCPADTGKARPNLPGCVVGHRRLRKGCRELGRGCAIVQGGRPQRPVAKHVGSNLWIPRQDTVAQVKTAAYTKTLPGAPAGEYAVIQYDSNFEHQPAAIETRFPPWTGLGRGESPATSFAGARHDEIPPASIPAICVTVYKPLT